MQIPTAETTVDQYYKYQPQDVMQATQHVQPENKLLHRAIKAATLIIVCLSFYKAVKAFPLSMLKMPGYGFALLTLNWEKLAPIVTPSAYKSTAKWVLIGITVSIMFMVKCYTAQIMDNGGFTTKSMAKVIAPKAIRSLVPVFGQLALVKDIIAC